MILEIQYIESNRNDRVQIQGNKCVIGRSTKADLQIDMDCFSRHHLQIDWDGKQFFVTDLNSTNGVYINGERIEPNNKTVFNSFFPLEIASRVSIMAHADEELSAAKSAPSPSFGSSSEPSSSHKTQTKTKAINDLPSSKSKTSKTDETIKSKTNSKPKNSALMLPLLVVLAGGGYFAYNYLQKLDESATAEAQAPASNKADVGLAPEMNIASEELKNIRQNQCAEMNGICESIKLVRPQEALMVKDDKLIVYVNLEAFASEIESATFSKQKLENQEEYFAGFYAFHPAVIAEAKKRKLAYVVAVGINPLDDIIRIKLSAAVDVKKSPELTAEFHKSFFSNIFFGGAFRPFKVDLKPYMKITR